MHCDNIQVKPEPIYDSALQYDSGYMSIVEELRVWKEQHRK